MTAERTPTMDNRTREALQALRDAISERYLSAAFDITHGDDPDGFCLRATVDIDDVDEVLEVVLDPLFTYQVEQGLSVYVLPLQPVERVLMESRRPHPRKRLRIELEEAAPPSGE